MLIPFFLAAQLTVRHSFPGGPFSLAGLVAATLVLLDATTVTLESREYDGGERKTHKLSGEFFGREGSFSIFMICVALAAVACYFGL
jgi:hypothetical protein